MINKFYQFYTRIKNKLAERDMPVAGAFAAFAVASLPLAILFAGSFVGIAALAGGGAVAAGAMGLVAPAIAVPALMAGAGAIAAATEAAVAAVQKSVTRGTRNEAGQTIVGSVYAIKRLEKAQMQITKITSTFNDATAKRAELIANVVAAVEPLRTQVQIFDAGSLHASTDKYDFKI